jgi:hypothetical protein
MIHLHDNFIYYYNVGVLNVFLLLYKLTKSQFVFFSENMYFQCILLNMSAYVCVTVY